MYAKHVLKTAIAYPQIQVSRNNRLTGAFQPQKNLAEHHYYIYRKGIRLADTCDIAAKTQTNSSKFSSNNTKNYQKMF